MDGYYLTNNETKYYVPDRCKLCKHFVDELNWECLRACYIQECFEDK